ncbi:MAG: IPT/TIG domain-containing protein [Acidobacteria bacterium]|nr:IPT/TIG domain-containing protein [Acidobacteriota bacterium]
MKSVIPLPSLFFLGLFHLYAGAAQPPRGLFSDASRVGVACPQDRPFDPVVVRSRDVIVDFGALGADGDARDVVLNLFDDVARTAIRDRVERRPAGCYSWFGHVQGNTQSQITLVVDGDTIVGNIREDLKMYQIRVACEGVHAVREVDASRYPDEAEPIRVEHGEDPVDVRSNAPAVTGNPTIDVLVLYTAAAASTSGNIAAEIQLGIDETNTQYANSAVNQRVNLVATYQVNYAESYNSNTDLTRVSSTSDGYIDEIHSLRDAFGADEVSFWLDSLEPNICGRGYIMTSVSTGFASSAFNVVWLNCATGYYSFGHEMGHNMGLRHDWYVDGNVTPYDYAHGYAYPAGSWRTVMAYNNACTASGTSCTRVPYYSNPSVNYSGAPTGVAGGGNPAENARALNDTAGTVAAFRSTVAGCVYWSYPSSAAVGSSGGTGSVPVVATAGCAWTAVSNAAWISVTGGSSGSGNGTVSYSVEANPDPSARASTITIAGQTFTITQSAGASCAYSIAPWSQAFAASGGPASVGVTTTSGCAWTAVSNAAWIIVTGGSSGSGSGTVSYSVATNLDASARTSTITIAGQTFTISQSGAGVTCSYLLSAASQPFVAAGGTGSVNVTADAGCAWSAVSNDVWITVTSGAASSGTGSVGYSVAANSSTSARTGTITIAEQTFTVTQEGATGGSTPSITGYKSKHNEPGSSAKLTGTGFKSTDTVKVKFGKKYATVKKVSSDSYVKFTIPSSLKSGKTYAVSLLVNGVSSNVINVKLD